MKVISSKVPDHTSRFCLDLSIPRSKTTPFHRTIEQEVSKKDKEFIGKIMMMDWRDRPTAKDLLQDQWFREEDGER
jgi:hypothetical protein